ncbi:MAG: DUF2244 domain-containing protein [Betaproteobacteria bacterium]|nr:DUF2244 domain-containing protein [Betaproteobacteria bacterium]
MPCWLKGFWGSFRREVSWAFRPSKKLESGDRVGACGGAPGIDLSDTAYHRRWLPNRSLTPAGRWVWLGMIGGMVAVIALGFAWAGIWWVLPFAGLELGLLVWAFNRIAVGDSDFESLDLQESEWAYQARRGGREVSVSGALSWLRVEQRRTRGRLVVGLCYAGRRYELGSFLSEDQRAGLARELAGLIRRAR